MDISYGLALEYGDTAAPDARIAARSLRDWGIGVGLVVGLAGWVVVAARRSRGRRAMTVTAVVAVVVTLVGVPGGAVLGVHQKFDAYPDLPSCTDGFRTAPPSRSSGRPRPGSPSLTTRDRSAAADRPGLTGLDPADG